jgi:hypothetical protein
LPIIEPAISDATLRRRMCVKNDTDSEETTGEAEQVLT